MVKNINPEVLVVLQVNSPGTTDWKTVRLPVYMYMFVRPASF
jgi:hypothetical protein